jgi:hypothetical protein
MFMPLILWAFRRLAVTGQGRYLAMSAITYAALILSHNVTALIFSPVLLAYSLFLTHDRTSLLHIDKNWWRALGMLLATMGLGLGLSSFFWLPVLVERNAIVADMLYSLPGLDYRQHFVPFNRLLSLPFITLPSPNLSLITVALALIGLGHIWLTSRPHPASGGAATLQFSPRLSRPSLFAALMAAACVAMALPFSVWLWEMIPALRFLQFPQRFLGIASLFVAFLAGVGAASLRQRFNRMQAAGLLLIIGVLLLGHTWGLEQVRYYPPLPAIDVNFIMQKERELGLANTIYSGNFIPATVKSLPSLAQLAQHGPERLDLTALPAGAQVIAAGYQPLRYELRLSSPRPFVAHFHTFYFPGWQAQLDGQPAPLTPTDPHGLIGVELPAGEHHLIIWFGSTPIRTLANTLTAISAVILGLATALIQFYTDCQVKGYKSFESLNR